MAGHLRLLMPMLVVGCVDLTRPPELIPSDTDAAVPGVPVEDASSASDGAIYPDLPADTPDSSAVTDPGDVAAGGMRDISGGSAADGPVLRPNGSACGGDGQCQSSLCVSGWCCNSACTGTCEACDLSGLEGTCSPVPAGQMRAGQCAAEAPSTCGRDGACDGRRGCRRYPAGTECAPGGCSGSTERAASTCDPAGKCQTGTTRSCAPNLCMGSSCGSRCTTGAECLPGFFCDSGACQVKRPLGAACSSAAQCASDNCVDRVCCNSDCSGTCLACNLPGSMGTCTPVPDMQDPGLECPLQPAPTCGRAGGCDGRGNCRVYSAGTPCGPPRSCTGSTETAASLCNGRGACEGGTTRDCGNFLCSQDSCATSCQSAAQCKQGLLCLGNACVPPRIADLIVNDTANASGWSRQVDFQIGQGGAHPWSDFGPSFIVSLDAGADFLKGAEWVRVSSESKNFTGGSSQATVVLSGTSDVYLVVDDRWPTFSFTSGWTNTGLRLHVFESSSRPSLGFAIYKKAAQKGGVALPIIGDNHAYNNFVIVN
jgi:hypothetical protein